MNAPTLTPGAVLAVAGVGVLAFVAWKASNAVGDAAEAISKAADDAAHFVYPDALLPKGQTMGDKLGDRYAGTTGVLDFLGKAWDGYWEDVGSLWGSVGFGDLWGSVGDSYLTDAQAIKARNEYAATDPRRVDLGGGASGSW